MGTVLIVEDEADLRFTLARVVRGEGYAVLEAGTAAEALDLLQRRIVSLVCLDIGLPDADGIELIREVKEAAPAADIVMLTGRNDAASAVRALKAGAVDYLLKPFDLAEFKHVLARIMQGRRATQLSALAAGDDALGRIVGESRPMAALRQRILAAASVTAPVLITGETGTGKELVARAIHDHTPGRQGLFVKVDCGTLAASVIESELFGHDRGAFTDARTAKRGLVELADGGTLFLDEIANLPLALQPVLLRLIEESTFRRVGGLQDIAVDLRIVAASNLDLREQVRGGTFREDLYYRLNVIPVATPPLRERGRDVLLLAAGFIERYARDLGKDVRGLAPATEAAFLRMAWPGNVRELKNLIEREVLFAATPWLTAIDGATGSVHTGGAADAGTPLCTLAEMERQHIRRVLAAAGQNKTRAAKILGISRTTLRDKLS